MENPIDEFSRFIKPDKTVQNNQYQRMLNLTRSAANAYTRLLGKKPRENTFIQHHLAELEALARSNNKGNVLNNFHGFREAIQQGRSNDDVMAQEVKLLQAIHQLETESPLDRLRGWKWPKIVVTGLIIAFVSGERAVAFVASIKNLFN